MPALLRLEHDLEEIHLPERPLFAKSLKEHFLFDVTQDESESLKLWKSGLPQRVIKQDGDTDGK